MADLNFNDIIIYCILFSSAAVVIAIIVFLSINDKIAQGVSDTVGMLYIKSILQLLITTETYSDSSNTGHWKAIANAISNWGGFSMRPMTLIGIDELLTAIEGSIKNTAHSDGQKEAMLICISNLKCKIEESLPNTLELNDIKIYPSWLEKNIRTFIYRSK